MEGLLVILLLLACPLGMTVIGIGAWTVARLRGEKRDLSVGCMGGHGEHQQTAAAQNSDAGLKEQLTELEREVTTLRARVDGSSGVDGTQPSDVDEKSSRAAHEDPHA